MKYYLIKNRTENYIGEKLIIQITEKSKYKSPIEWIKVFRPDWVGCKIYSEPEFLAMISKEENSISQQSEIVKQRLHYHFAKVGGGWDIEGMNAPFMNEFLNEVQKLVELIEKQ